MNVSCVCVCVLQTLCLAIGRGILYSAGTDLCLRSWHLETLEELAIVQVQYIILYWCVIKCCISHISAYSLLGASYILIKHTVFPLLGIIIRL